MNNKGQGILEILFCFGGAILVTAIVIALVTTGNAGDNTNNLDVIAEKFCTDWAEENDLILLKGYYKEYLFFESDIVCNYSTEAETFNGVVSTGAAKSKLFEISEKDLLKLYHKEKEDNCCEVCN